MDLYENKEPSILNEFFFSFLITKFYSNNENIIYIPKNIEIFIEIPNCFDDFMKNYNILTFFKEDKIKIKPIPPLQLSDDKILLFNKMLNLDSNEKIDSFIKEKLNKIKLTKYSYHQINIFINLFISQYNKFPNKKLQFINNGEDKTKDCIDYFAEGTKYFINGEFPKMLLELIESEKKKREDYIDLLSINYDNDLKKEFDQPLIFLIKDKKIYYSLNLSKKSLE